MTCNQSESLTLPPRKAALPWLMGLAFIGLGVLMKRWQAKHEGAIEAV